MSRLRVTGRQLIRALQRAGFSVVRIKGSHYFLRHADGRVTVVPAHTGETIGPGLSVLSAVSAVNPIPFVSIRLPRRSIGVGGCSFVSIRD